MDRNKQLKDSLIALFLLMLKHKDNKEFKKLLVLYKNSREELKDYVGKIYLKYIKNNELNMTYTDIDKEIKRLEPELKSIGNNLKKQENIMLNYLLFMTYEDTYSKGNNILSKYIQDSVNKKSDDKTIQNVINIKIDGKDNAQRNKANKDKMINKVKNDIKKDFKGKKSIEVINKNIDKDFNSGANASDKLLNNEEARVFTSALMQDYKDNGINKVEWVSQLEERTCKECAELNEQVFDIDDAPIPILDTHVNCLCVLIPVIN